MYYAKSEPVETITEHTNKLLKNLNLLKKVYENQIINKVNFNTDRFWLLLEIICKYHDFGKVYTPFQNQIRKKIKEPLLKTEFTYELIKHEQISPMFVPIEKYDLSKDEQKLIYQAIYYHHERDVKEINNMYVQEIIEKDIIPQLQQIKQEIPFDIPDKLECKYIKLIKKRIVEEDVLFQEYCLLKGILHRLDHSSSADLEVEDATVENITKYINLFMKERNFQKNKLQEFAEENRNKNILVIGSTGMGKTEASLLWSNGAKTFFTLPIRTSINAIYDRIKENFKYNNVGLLHSTALDYLEEKDEFNNQEEKYKQSQNLYNKITTCTIDQIFPFVFKYKGYEKIYSTLCYSKVIIDEIQAYSPEIVAVIIKGLQMINQIGGNFMVMTATLPQIYKNELRKLKIDFEYGKYIKPTSRHKIKIEEKDILDDTEVITRKSKSKKILIIANTVNKAIEIYLKLKEEKGNNINLLHSRFIYNDRSMKEEDIKKFSDQKGKNGIWITTQIVEASLDIDFDYLYTEMSTLDSLFQRLGRCYRSREYTNLEENVYIYTKNISGIKYIYDEDINKKSMELLKRYDKKFLEEQEKVYLVDKLYSEEMLEGTEFLKKFKSGLQTLENIIDYKTGKKEAQKLLRNIENITVIPKSIYEQNIILFEEYAQEKSNKKRREIKRKIDRLTTCISQGQYFKLKDRLIKLEIIPDIFIIDLKYDKEMGLMLKQDEEYDDNEKFL